MARWINSDAFLGTMREVRTVWLSGIFGTGKTLTAVAIGAKLLSDGYAEYFISNIPVNGMDEPKAPMENAMVLMDEAHLFLPSWDTVRAYAGFLRKVNMRLLMPSVYPPHGKLRILELQRVFTGYRIGGMLTPFWLYKWRVNAGMFSEKGTAMLWRPHDLFGVYDTDNVVATDADDNILAAVTETIAIKSGKALSEYGLRKNDNIQSGRTKSAVSKARTYRKRQGETGAETFRDAANTITDAAGSIGESAERISRSLRKY